MIAPAGNRLLDQETNDLLRTSLTFGIAARRACERCGGLSDAKLLVLLALKQHGTMTVGSLRRLLGVKPAAMSRLLRSLEARREPFISCRRSAHDRRTVDVSLEQSGHKALVEYEAICAKELVKLATLNRNSI
jgi:DNA-binding MarR family transcriptional regulator